MRRDVATFLLIFLFAVPAWPTGAQEKPVTLSGNANVGYTSSRDSIAPAPGAPSDPAIDEGAFHELDLGLDLHAGTYILSPKFIAVTADVGLSTLRNGTADRQDNQHLQSQTYVVNVLPRSVFPFRFLYNRENTGFSQAHETIYSSRMRELRLDWQLRKRNLPQLWVVYDSRTNNSGTIENSNQATSNHGLSITAKQQVFGWDASGAYENRTTSYELTGLDTRLSTFRFDARKTLSPNSNASLHASQQTMDFNPTATVVGQRFSFLDVRAQYDAHLGRRLSVQAYYQLYASTTETQPSLATRPTGLFAPLENQIKDQNDLVSSGTVAPLPASVFAARPELNFGLPAAVPASRSWKGAATASAGTGLFAPPALTAPPPGDGGVGSQFATIDTSSNSFTGQANYVVLPSVLVGGAVTLSLITPPSQQFEEATRLLDTQANASWGHRFGFVTARANGTYGVETARSNHGNTGSAPFYNAGLGFSAGNGSHLVVYGDVNRLRREDVFLTGGFADETSLSGGVEAQLFPSLRLTATANFSDYGDVNPQGREHFTRKMYAVGLEHRLVSFLYSQNITVGDRDVFSSPFEITSDRLFYQLPVASLIPDPLERTRADFTQAILRFRLVRDLDLEAQYIHNISDFVEARDSNGRQLEVLATYKLGKFTFRAGALIEHLDIEDSPARDRTQYFFRVSRAFRIF